MKTYVDLVSEMGLDNIHFFQGEMAYRLERRIIDWRKDPDMDPVRKEIVDKFRNICRQIEGMTGKLMLEIGDFSMQNYLEFRPTRRLHFEAKCRKILIGLMRIEQYRSEFDEDLWKYYEQRFKPFFPEIMRVLREYSCRIPKPEDQKILSEFMQVLQRFSELMEEYHTYEEIADRLRLLNALPSAKSIRFKAPHAKKLIERILPYAPFYLEKTYLNRNSKVQELVKFVWKEEPDGNAG